MPGSQISGRARTKSSPNSTTERVREVRAKLANDTDFNPEFAYDRLMMFVRNEIAAVITLPLLAIVIAIALLSWAPADDVLTWLFVVLATKILLLSFCHGFTNVPREEMNVGRWHRKLVSLEFIHGIAWSGVAFIGLNLTDPAVHMLVFAAVIVIIAVRIMFASSVMAIVFAGTVPLTVALLARFIYLDNPFYFALASLGCGVHVYFFFLAKGLSSTVGTMLEFRAEKDLLIAELEEAKAISDSARARAEAASMAKSRFLATMSHELRTPLNAILGFSEVMERELMGPLNNENYKEYAGNIHDSGQHLLKIINEILDLSRIEAGRYELEEKDFLLSDVASQCNKLLKLKASGKSITFVENYAEALDPIWADERSVHQICLNLLSNAIKFTPPHGTITTEVGATPDGKQYLTITDTGPGIPEDEIPKVMQSFGQGSLAHENAEGGTGLGLPIVKNLIELHGGNFELSSTLRKGTTVSVFFPESRVLNAMPPLQPLGEERHRRQSSIVDVVAPTHNDSLPRRPDTPARRPSIRRTLRSAAPSGN